MGISNREYFHDFLEKLIKSYMCCEDFFVSVSLNDKILMSDESIDLSDLNQKSIIAFSDAFILKTVDGLQKILGNELRIDMNSIINDSYILDNMNMIVVKFTVSIFDIPVQFMLGPSRYDDMRYVISEFKIFNDDFSLRFSDYVLTRRETPMFVFEVYRCDNIFRPVYKLFLKHRPLSYFYDDMTNDVWYEIATTITNLCFDADK